MVIGDITKAMGLIGEIAIAGDDTKVAKVRTDLILLQSRTEIFATVTMLRKNVDTAIGYIAGMYTPELGNQVLKVFRVKHPYFGDHIPDSATEALEMGKKLGKEYAKKLQTEAEIAKKNAQVAELGVMLPESDEAVTNDDAAKILAALKEKRDKKVNPMLMGAPGPMRAIKASNMEDELKAMKAELIAAIGKPD